MTGELPKICSVCPIENPRFGHCVQCDRYHRSRGSGEGIWDVANPDYEEPEPHFKEVEI